MLDLISNGILTGLHNNGTGTANICATLCGVNITARQVSSAVYFNVSIIRSTLHILCRCRIGQIHMGCITGTAEGGTFFYSICCNFRSPLIIVIDIDFIAAAQRAGCTRTDNQSCTGLQSDVLRHRYRAAVHVNGHVAVDGQDIVLGIDGFTTKHTDLHGDAQTLDRQIAIHIDQQSAGIFIIVLDDMTTGNLEHTIGANERNRGALNANQSNGNGHIALFDCAGLQCHGHFDVLDIVLGHGEYSVAVANHAGSIVAAAPVLNLEALIDSTTVFHGHSAAALDVAPGIQITAIVDSNGAAGVHLDKATGFDRATVTTGCGLQSRQA